MTRVPSWKQYQENVAEFFRGLGLSAETDVTVEGARTTHAIDVYVVGTLKSINVVWLVECKHWKSKATKGAVLLLRQIVTDVGADRGFFMAESGYQKGALEAARSANIQLLSLADLRETCRFDLMMVKARDLFAVAGILNARYWELGKELRIDHGLRHDVMQSGYSGDRAMKAIQRVIQESFFKGFPVEYDEVGVAFAGAFGDVTPSKIVFSNPDELVEFCASEVEQLDRLLCVAEKANYKPAN